MKRLSTLLATIAFAAVAVPASAKSIVIASGRFMAREFTDFYSGFSDNEGFDLPPGDYRVTLNISAPNEYFQGSANTLPTFNWYCDFKDGQGVHYCGGDESTSYHDFVHVGPGHYVAQVHVERPYSEYFNDDDPLVRADYTDRLYYASGEFFPLRAGNYVLSYGLGTPEPQAWALMIAGFGAVGWAMRRRQSAPSQLQSSKPRLA